MFLFLRNIGSNDETSFWLEVAFHNRVTNYPLVLQCRGEQEIKKGKIVIKYNEKKKEWL